MQAVIGIDPGSKTGLALIIDSRLVWCGHILMQKKPHTRRPTVNALVDALDKHRCNFIVCEQTPMNKKNNSAPVVLRMAGGITALIEDEIMARNMPLPDVSMVPCTSWRKDVFGVGNVEGGGEAMKAMALRYCDEHFWGWAAMSGERNAEYLKNVAEAICIGASVALKRVDAGCN